MPLDLKPHKPTGAEPTQEEIDKKRAEVQSWLPAGTPGNWNPNADMLLTTTPDTTKNEKGSVQEVVRLGLPHDAGPSKHMHWWKNGGTLADVGPSPEPPPSEYAEEPPVTFPPYQVAYDIFSRYPEGSVWVKLGPSQLQQAIARTSYGIVWSGQRAANLDERIVRAAQDAEPGILPDMWFTGWMTGAQGFDVVDGMTPGSELRKAYIGVTAESYLKQQLEAGAGPGPSGA